jgi:hypothetical protein
MSLASLCQSSVAFSSSVTGDQSLELRPTWLVQDDHLISRILNHMCTDFFLISHVHGFQGQDQDVDIGFEGQCSDPGLGHHRISSLGHLIVC